MEKSMSRNKKDMTMNYVNYQRVLNNVIKCAPLECGVQTLIFILLDEIIYDIKDEKLKVLVADLRDNNSIFGGDGGVLDLCIVNNNFEYVKKPLVDEIDKLSPRRIRDILKQYDCFEEQQRKEQENKISRKDIVLFRKEQLKEKNEKLKADFNAQKRNRLCCIEIKVPGVPLPSDNEQLTGHIFEYKKILYTNGLVWNYLEINNASDKTEIRKFIYSSLKERIDESVKENKIIYLEGIITGWIIPIAFDEQEKMSALNYATKEVKINEGNFNALVQELRKIIEKLK